MSSSGDSCWPTVTKLKKNKVLAGGNGGGGKNRQLTVYCELWTERLIIQVGHNGRETQDWWGHCDDNLVDNWLPLITLWL